MSGPLSPGDVIGSRYAIERYVDEGGMQFVYAAFDQLTARRIALKTPKNPSAQKRFKRSAVVAAKVNHPNVAKTLDYIEQGEDQYLIEELIVGKDLDKAILKRVKFLDPYLAAKVFHHLAKGIGAAHHAKVIHRDLKPTNIMVDGDYSEFRLKITDFGIAKLAEEELEGFVEDVEATLSNSSTAVGALPYMAPEAIDTPKAVTSKADIWSLGAMMYRLLTGELPFGTGLRAVGKILAAEMPQAPGFLSANAQFSPLANELLGLSLSCMRKNPDERPTADDLVTACGRLCYSPAARAEGIIKTIKFNSWGFIDCGERDEIFFNFDSFYGVDRPKIGDLVGFSRHAGQGAYRAHPMVQITPLAP